MLRGEIWLQRVAWWIWVTFEVWLHKIAWGETVDCLQELQCSMAQVRVWEQEEEPPETDEENQESEEGSGARREG